MPHGRKRDINTLYPLVAVLQSCYNAGEIDGKGRTDMPKLAAYDRALPYSYAPGIFPSFALLDARPDAARRLLIHSGSAGHDGMDGLIRRAEALGLRVEEADRALARISRKENCYAAMVFDKFAGPLDAGVPHVVLVSPSDMGNLGTILRSCLGFGLRDLAIVGPAADVFDPRVVRASMGALFSMRIALYDSFAAYRAAHPAHAVYPFMLDGALPLAAAVSRRSKARPYALVFGNEATGLDASYAAEGQAVRIPHTADVDSLNLAVAVSIAAYAFTAQS